MTECVRELGTFHFECGSELIRRGSLRWTHTGCSGKLSLAHSAAIFSDSQTLISDW